MNGRLAPLWYSSTPNSLSEFLGHSSSSHRLIRIVVSGPHSGLFTCIKPIVAWNFNSFAKQLNGGKCWYGLNFRLHHCHSYSTIIILHEFLFFFWVTSQYPHLLLHIPLWAIPPYPIHLQYCRKTVTTLCMWWLEHITVWLWHIPLSRVVIWVFFLSSYGFSSTKWDVCHWSWIFTNFWEASIQTQKGAICWG